MAHLLYTLMVPSGLIVTPMEHLEAEFGGLSSELSGERTVMPDGEDADHQVERRGWRSG